MIRNIFKSIEVLIDMYYHRKKLVTRYRRIKRYQRTGEIADINKIDKIRDRDLKLLNDCLQEQLKTILKDAGVKADMFSNGTIGITVWYNGKPFTKRTCNYYDFSSNLNNCMDIIDTMVKEIKNQELSKDYTLNNNSCRGLELMIKKELNPILKGVEVNVSKTYQGPIRVEVSYKDCTEWFELSEYIPKKELFVEILPRVKRVACNLSDKQREYELNERIKLNRFSGEIRGLIRSKYPSIDVELYKGSTGKGYVLVLERYGMKSTIYLLKDSGYDKYLDEAEIFNDKVDKEIQKKQEEKDKKKALLKKNNPLNLKVGETYQARYKFSNYWELVYIERITTDGFPWRRTEMSSGIFDVENYDVKTQDGKWIHNRKAWEEFQAKKNNSLRVKYTIPNYRELGLLSHKGIDLQTINH